MCCSYAIHTDLDDIAERFNLQKPKQEVYPRFNARPTQTLPVWQSGTGQISLLHWGLKPAWMTKKGIKRELFNIRVESADKFSFKTDFKKHRLIVFADGFFEWKAEKNGKQPYYFKLKSGDVMLFAGLWQEHFENKDLAYAIITMSPNSIVKEVHDRMPMILNESQAKEWLRSDLNVEEFLEKITPISTSQIECYPVTTLVNKPINDFSEIMKPLNLDS